MATQKAVPTLRETLAGYRRFNAWESAEQQRELPNLSIKESLTQFFELYDVTYDLASGTEQTFQPAFVIARSEATKQSPRCKAEIPSPPESALSQSHELAEGEGKGGGSP